MTPYKTPQADTKRLYTLHKEVGLLIALGIALAAFTIPFSADEEVEAVETTQEIIELEDVDVTSQVTPPPPPPAPPPPREVPDGVEIEEQIIEAIDLDLGAQVAVPLAPPAPEAPPPPPPAPEPQAAAPPPPPPPEPEPEEPEVFEAVEVPPTLIGGLEGLQARLVYPEMAIQGNVSGTVYVQFVVDETGAVTEPTILRSPNDILSQAAIDAILASRFTPGLQRGRAVPVRFTVPVKFELR